MAHLQLKRIMKTSLGKLLFYIVKNVDVFYNQQHRQCIQIDIYSLFNKYSGMSKPNTFVFLLQIFQLFKHFDF